MECGLWNFSILFQRFIKILPVWHGPCRGMGEMHHIDPNNPERQRLIVMNRMHEDHRPRSQDNWIERAGAYLRSRTADHWMMFAAGMLLGAILS